MEALLNEEITLVDDSINKLAQKIRETREKQGTQPTAAQLIALCPTPMQNSIISVDEVIALCNAITGRRITKDYIKHLRLAQRLIPFKRVSKRVSVYRLRDVFFVEYPTVGRPKKSM